MECHETARKKIKLKFSCEEGSWFSPQIMCNRAFHIGHVLIKKYELKLLFLLFNLNETGKVFFEMMYSPLPPIFKQILLHTIVVCVIYNVPAGLHLCCSNTTKMGPEVIKLFSCTAQLSKKF